ncbi:hypothetical protein [Spirosoma flavum]|uniref:Uncharacterized protein n=1 Tax=Spirosoma flavum TaxID=2048557 RepID=A0ABW6AK15_9BACT
MKTHEQLVEEVYNNTSFRAEFMSYVKLWKTLKTEQQIRPKAPSAPNQSGAKFISYHDMITGATKVDPDSPLVSKCKRGIALLYSSLFRGLSVVHKVDAEEARRLIVGVAERIEQMDSR